MSQADTPPILPPDTIGVLGGGQLGRMLGMVARRMGYGFSVYSDSPRSPAGALADTEAVGAYDDADTVREWAKSCAVVTFEFENVASAVADAARQVTRVRPDGRILHTTQNRLREKTWLLVNGFPVAPFAPVKSDDDLLDALNVITLPGILKTSEGGYDGKGQQVVRSIGDMWAAKAEFGSRELILEGFVEFEREISVVVSRSTSGNIRAFVPCENRHINGILDVTISPANLPMQQLRDSQILAAEIAEELEYIGVLCVEMFVLEDGSLLVNELAPRPHNSGHHTLESCVTSQFEQQVRAICGLPLGDTTHYQSAAMANLLGDLWTGGTPNFAAALAVPGVVLHLYGKEFARPGRKMGHLTACAAATRDAEQMVLAARNALMNSEANVG